MLQRHVAHVERLEYELGLFSSSAFNTDPVELKQYLAEHLKEALARERQIVHLLERLEGTSSNVVNPIASYRPLPG